MIVIIIAIISAVVGLLVLRAYITITGQIKSYEQYWQQQSSVNSQEYAVRYFAMGDSAAQSIGASSPSKGYVGLISEHIRQSVSPVQVINLSKSGAKTDDVLRRQLPALMDMQPTENDIITLEIGANNVVDYNEHTFTLDMKEILDTVPPQTIVADVPYFGGGIRRNAAMNAEQASRIIRELCEERGLRIAYLQKITTENDSIRNYSADFFHPSDRAYKFWFKAFMPHISDDIAKNTQQ